MEPGQSIRVLVTGGRDYRDRARVSAVLSALDGKYPIDAIIQGAARGADELSAHWGWDNGRKVYSFAADWDKHGRKAGILRNIEMLNESSPDCVVAFPGGRGTAHMVGLAKKAGLPVWEIV